MLKCATKTSDGRPMLVLGLSGENMTRLMADEPIFMQLRELGLPDMVLLIMGGRDENAMLNLIAESGIQFNVRHESCDHEECRR